MSESELNGDVEANEQRARAEAAESRVAEIMATIRTMRAQAVKARSAACPSALSGSKDSQRFDEAVGYADALLDLLRKLGEQS